MSLLSALWVAGGTAWGVALSWFDCKERRLPNWLTLGGAAVFLVLRLVWSWQEGTPGRFFDGLLAAAICGAFMLVPFLARGAGGGDVKMLFAAGGIVGTARVLPLIWFTSLAGLALGIGMLLAGALDGSRLKHAVRCLVDWRYDRKAGAATLPSQESERVRVPFSVPITVGLTLALLLNP